MSVKKFILAEQEFFTMFDKLKQLNEARKMQNLLKSEIIEYEESGIKIVFNGIMELIDLKLNPEYEIEMQEKKLKQAFQNATKKVQMQIAQKMMGL